MSVKFDVSELEACKCPKYVTRMIGQSFNLLFVESLAGIRKDKHYVNCICKGCDGVGVFAASNLLSSSTKSCGCDRGPSISRMKMVHGGSHDGPLKVEYRAWRSMRERCLNPKHYAYHNYGGRGITVCDEWAYTGGGFENFYRDMGNRPKGKFSIERIDNMKGYYRENCTWILKKLQPKNRRTTWKVCFNGKVMPASDVANILGYSRHTIAAWLSKNYKSKARVINIQKFLQWGNRRGPRKNKTS